MSAERRLAKLEGTLTPKAATLLWLTEAHTFHTLGAYVGWLVDQPASAAPLYRVPQAAEAGVRSALRGQKQDARERAVREAVSQAVFLVELIIRLNVAAEETTRIEGLRHAALFWKMRAIRAEALLETARSSRAPRGKPTSAWPAWRAAVASLVDELCVAEQARAQLERRYLDGQASLFPALAADWQRLSERAEGLVGLDDEAQGRPPRRGRRTRPLSRFARSSQAQATHLLEIARSVALDLLGDTDGAAAIAGRRI